MRVKKLYQTLAALTPVALQVMQAEYEKPHRAKLTHVWLARSMGIENWLAFKLLEQLARKQFMCVQLPNGKIFWDNTTFSIGEVLAMLRQSK